MTQNSNLELRVYAGIHAGARVALTPGSYVLGSDPACDFIFADDGFAGRHVELRFEDECKLYPLSADAGIAPEGMRFEKNFGVEIGAAIIAVEAADAPWQEPDWVVLPVLPYEETENDDELVESPILPEMTSKVTPAATNRRYGLYLWPGLIFVVVLTAILIFLLHNEEPTPALISAANHPSTQAQVLAVIEKLKLTKQAQVERKADGTISVRATLSDEDYEKLALALSKINPRPQLKVTPEQELNRSIREFLAAYGKTLSAESLGASRFKIKGLVASEPERAALLRALTIEFPAAGGFENAMVTKAAFAETVLAELRENNAMDIQSHWEDDVFQVAAKIPVDQASQWEEWQIQAEKRHGKWLKIALTADAEQISLPLQIGAIISGKTSFVVLADGRKILPGGSIDGWQLVEIKPESVVFDGPRRVVIRRK